MFIKDYISKDYPAFGVRDSIEEASEVAKEFGYSHVFIVNKGIFLGGLSQPFLEDSPEGNLDSLNIHYERFAIMEDSSLLDSIKLFHTFNANVVAVISKEEKYLGYISCDDIFNEFSKYPLFFKMSIIVAESFKYPFRFSKWSRYQYSNAGLEYAILYPCFSE